MMQKKNLKKIQNSLKKSHFNFQEEVFFEYECSMMKTLSVISGRMYLTESFVCFAASMLGIEQKVNFPISYC